MNHIFYYPNRPTLVPPDPKDPLNPKPNYINSLESTGKYIAEYKFNGDNTLIYTDDLSFWNREGKRLCYTPIPEILTELKKFPKGCILNAETMHRHTKFVKNLIILHSALAWEGSLLIGNTWGNARLLLEEQKWLPNTEGTKLNYKCHVLLSQTYTNNFWSMFERARACDDAIEGIVLKNPHGKLQFSVSPLTDVPYMLKIRKPCKKYSY